MSSRGAGMVYDCPWRLEKSEVIPMKRVRKNWGLENVFILGVHLVRRSQKTDVPKLKRHVNTPESCMVSTLTLLRLSEHDHSPAVPKVAT